MYDSIVHPGFYRVAVLRKWGVSNYFFLEGWEVAGGKGCWSFCSRDMSRERADVSREDILEGDDVLRGTFLETPPK
jgi:hypothetical protein